MNFGGKENAARVVIKFMFHCVSSEVHYRLVRTPWASDIHAEGAESFLESLAYDSYAACLEIMIVRSGILSKMDLSPIGNMIQASPNAT